MEQAKLDEYVRAFHMMWDNYPEPVRLIDRTFTIVAGNKLYMKNSGGRFLGTKCNQAGDPSLHRGCKAMESLRTGEARIVTANMEGVRWDSYWVPVEGTDELYVHFTDGISAYREMKLRQQQEQQ